MGAGDEADRASQTSIEQITPATSPLGHAASSAALPQSAEGVLSGHGRPFTPPPTTGASARSPTRAGSQSPSRSPSTPRNGAQRRANGDQQHQQQHQQQGSPSSSPSSAYNDGSSSSPASTNSAATAHNHANRRVKAYRLHDDKWIDLGTGHCFVHLIEPPLQPSASPTANELHAREEGAWIIVRKETKDEEVEGQIILKTKVTPGPPGYMSDEDDEVESESPNGGKTVEYGGYQRQQDTLIVWTERDTEHEMALSFATPTGCGEIWDFIKAARKWLHDQTLGSPSPSPSMSSPQPFPNYNILPIPTKIPDPTLGNLAEVDEAIRAMSRTAVGRERTASMIVRGQVIQKLVCVHDEAEDLESLPELHALCRIMQTILLLNDNVIFELILRDDMILGVVSILEYDPEFPTMKASYREHLADPSHFTEVVPIRNQSLLSKIHQTHRLHYLKDVVLARVIEDSTFSMLNSAIYFNEVDIVNEVGSDAEFIKELFAIFDEDEAESQDKGKQKEVVPSIGPQLPPQSTNEPGPSRLEAGPATISHAQDRKHDAILFLQQFALMAKNLQLQARASFFRSLADKGLLRVIEVALSSPTTRDDPTTRSATIAVLMTLVDHDPNNVRGYSLRQKSTGKRPLIEFLIDLFHNEEDLGLKAQMSEALRVLVDAVGDGGPLEAPPRLRQEDPEAEKFLQYFYDHCVTQLFRPILSFPPASKNEPLKLSIQEIALCGHLCDLLCFFINHHSFRSKYFVLSSDVGPNTAKLFTVRHKHMRLAALRVFRAAVNKNDDFYNRFLIKHDLFRPALEIAEDERQRDNLLRSAALEFFEYIRTTNAKAVINHVVDRYGDRVRSLAKDLKTFENLVLKWEQNNEPPPQTNATAGATSAMMTRENSKTWLRLELEDEERYFNDDSDDEQQDLSSGASASGPSRTSRKREGPPTDTAAGGQTATSSPPVGKRLRLEKTRSLSSLPLDVVNPPSSTRAPTDDAATTIGTASTPSGSTAGVKRPLVDYAGDDDSDEERDVNANAGGVMDVSGQGGFIRSGETASSEVSDPTNAKRPRTEPQDVASGPKAETDTTTDAPSLPPLRKKTDEEDEDEDGQLGLLRRRGSMSDATGGGGPAGSKLVKSSSIGGAGSEASATSSSSSSSSSSSKPGEKIKIAFGGIGGGIKSSLAKLGGGGGKQGGDSRSSDGAPEASRQT